MKRLALLAGVFLIVVVFPADLALSEAQKPIHDPEGCVTCTRDHDTNAGKCGTDAGWGEPSNWICTGGYYCWNTADGQKVCDPYCGTRCYSI
jgi:hypothetical protein